MRGALAALISLLLSATALAAPSRIVDGWYAHNATLIMLGASGHVVGTVVSPSHFAWMYRAAPALNKATVFNSMVLNGEAVLALHPDLVFVTRESNSVQALSSLGFHTVAVGFTDFEGMLQTIKKTADLLDDKAAQDQAALYVTAFRKALDENDMEMSETPPHVLHIASFSPLTIDGDQSIIDEWIRHAGGVNAAQGIHGNKRPVSIEQIMSWNPDLVIVGADAGDASALSDQTLWDRIPAVQNRRVFRNPSGVFNWDRYSPELLLQLAWARGIIRTGSLDRADMIARIMAFYRDFYHFPISESDARRILDALPPDPVE